MKAFFFNVEVDTLFPHEFNSSNDIPISMHWDNNDSRVVACVIESYKNSNKDKAVSREVQSLFVTPEHAILVQDKCKIVDNVENLIGISMPYHYYCKVCMLFFLKRY